MGFFGRRQKRAEFDDLKWDYISLRDFKAAGMGPGFAYGWLWAMLIVSVAVYALDSFTAVNLLIFDKWSSNIKPGIPLSVSKWIFSVCIILSFINLGYEAVRAFRVIKRRNVAECYLDSLAVRWESVRVGGGQGYRRFLVFAELTKSKKGGQYVALFTYFGLQSWIRVLICSGPRQVINAFTLKSLYESKLLVSEESVEGSLETFFKKIGALANEDYQQALVLGAMVFTLVVWVFSFIFLFASVVFYLTFLIHWIPRSDGGLTGYCERKINQALKRIVTEKVNVALAKGEQKQMKAELKAAKKNGFDAPEFQRQATLPTLPNIAPTSTPSPMAKIDEKGDSLPEMPSLRRSDTGATGMTLPPYTSRPASPGGFELGSMNRGAAARRMPPSRTGTMNSTSSGRPYDADTSLLSSAAEMGQGRPPSPVPSIPSVANDYMSPGPGTPASQRSFGPSATPNPNYRPGTANSVASRAMYTASPNPMNPQQPQQAFSPYAGSNGRASPALSFRSAPGAGGPQYPQGMMQQPARSATGPLPQRGPYRPPPQRNMTAPMGRVPEGGYYDAPGTPQSGRGTPQPQPQAYQPYQPQGPPQGQGYGYDVESQRGYY